MVAVMKSGGEAEILVGEAPPTAEEAPRDALLARAPESP
jgi:hypothetical protein